MYIGYIKDRQDLGFMCLKDIEDQKQITLILKKGILYISITIFINSSLFMSDLELISQSYSDKPSHEIIISSILNQKLNTLKDYHNRGLNVQIENVTDDISSKHLINGLRGGANNLPDNTDQNLVQINETLKELGKSDKLQKNVTSKSVEYSRTFTDSSFNKIFIEIIDKIAPIVGNPKLLRVFVETQNPIKSELSISVQSSSKDIMGPKPQKISGKKSPSIFAEALVAVNRRRWPAFTAGSAMTSEMPDIKDKLQIDGRQRLRNCQTYLI